MTGIFRKADTDNSGTIPLPEFHAAIRNADLNLTLYPNLPFSPPNR
jgi:hypothetical protein